MITRLKPQQGLNVIIVHAFLPLHQLHCLSIQIYWKFTFLKSDWAPAKISNSQSSIFQILTNHIVYSFFHLIKDIFISFT